MALPITASAPSQWEDKNILISHSINYSHLIKGPFAGLINTLNKEDTCNTVLGFPSNLRPVLIFVRVLLDCVLLFFKEDSKLP